ncbi:MAG: hypothetical protein ACK5PW_14730 [Burkholderiales bacterium]
MCAGLPSDRWLANGNPGGDHSNMLSLANALAEVHAERFVLVATRFAATHVLRLPEAFGPDMRRNVLDDLIRRRELDGVDPRATYQWYPIARLADDIDRVIRLGLPQVSLRSAPVDIARLHRAPVRAHAARAQPGGRRGLPDVGRPRGRRDPSVAAHARAVRRPRLLSGRRADQRGRSAAGAAGLRRGAPNMPAASSRQRA